MTSIKIIETLSKEVDRVKEITDESVQSFYLDGYVAGLRYAMGTIKDSDFKELVEMAMFYGEN